jgi:hypothetical protein
MAATRHRGMLHGDNVPARGQRGDRCGRRPELMSQSHLGKVVHWHSLQRGLCLGGMRRSTSLHAEHARSIGAQASNGGFPAAAAASGSVAPVLSGAGGNAVLRLRLVAVRRP